MKTKEVIEFCKLQGSYCPQHHIRQNYYNIISLLQEGEKYKEMWEELSKRYGNYFSTFDVRKTNDIEYKYLDELMVPIKQKYFPKEVKQAEADEEVEI